MKFPAIFIGVALTVTVFAGLTLSHQESAQAQLTVCESGFILVRGGCVSVGGESPTPVPTPALLPGLIGLGLGLLRKRKAE